MGLIALACLSCLIAAPPLEVAQGRDAIVHAFMERNHVPGLAFVVLQNGSLITHGEFGVEDEKTKKPITTNSVFPIASLSKPFVALGILSLAEGNQVRLDDQVGQYLPTLPDDWKPIPLKRLLDHTSGVPDHYNAGVWNVLDPAPISSGELIKKLITLPLEFHPGSRYKYSNGNYVLLAKVIEVVTKKPYGEFLADRIFNPLGMMHTKTLAIADLVSCVSGYTTQDEKPKQVAWNPDWCFGNGAIGATSLDLARLDIGLYTDRIVHRTTLTAITMPQPLSDGSSPGYAMGWMLGASRGVKSVGHDGKIDGWRSCLVRFNDSKVTVIVLANNGDVGLYSLAADLGGTIISELSLDPMPEDNPDLTKADRLFVESIKSGSVTVSELSKGVAQDYEAKDHWSSLKSELSKAGDLSLFAPSSRAPTNSGVKTSYRLEAGDRVMKVVVGRDSAGLVNSLMFYSG